MRELSYIRLQTLYHLLVRGGKLTVLLGRSSSTGESGGSL